MPVPDLHRPDIPMSSRHFAAAAAALIVTLPSAADAGWINEFHYDNTGGDVGEFVEIVLGAGEDIADFEVVLYNGNGGSSYGTINFSGLGTAVGEFTIFQGSGPSIQNGAPDGLALVDTVTNSVVSSGGVTQFLSYEGAFTAVGGAADGLMSTDIGVSEPGDTPVGQSLQLAGLNGSDYSDFTWQPPAAQTPGALNVGQSFAPAPVPEPATTGLMLLGLLGGGAAGWRKRRAATV